jgi:YD repeat-containing protein
LYASDLDPMGTKWGEAMPNPCVYFVWNAKAGMKAMDGPALRPCEQKLMRSDDESTEIVQVDLLTQTVRAARMDLYLPDSVPIRFERVLRPGGTNPTEFGVSGSHSYDKYLWAKSMSTLHLTGPEFTNEDLRREPWWLPYEPVNRWVDADSSGRLLTLTHHTLPHEHYELRDLHGNVSDYLPCEGSIPCYLNGYRDADGRALLFDRTGVNRRLDKLTSPNGSWLKLEYDDKERLTSIYDSNGRYVKYGYNAQSQLVSVRHADGSVMSYGYDDQQRLLTLSVATNEDTAPQELLRNTYDASGRVTVQTLAGGEMYRYVHHAAKGKWRRWITVETPDGRSTEVYVEGWRAGLWRTDSPLASKVN